MRSWHWRTELNLFQPEARQRLALALSGVMHVIVKGQWTALASVRSMGGRRRLDCSGDDVMGHVCFAAEKMALHTQRHRSVGRDLRSRRSGASAFCNLGDEFTEHPCVERTGHLVGGGRGVDFAGVFLVTRSA